MQPPLHSPQFLLFMFYCSRLLTQWGLVGVEHRRCYSNIILPFLFFFFFLSISQSWNAAASLHQELNHPGATTRTLSSLGDQLLWRTYGACNDRVCDRPLEVDHWLLMLTALMRPTIVTSAITFSLTAQLSHSNE